MYGRLVRPGPTVNQILDRGAYPSAVSPYGVGLYETEPVRSFCLRSVKWAGTLVRSSPSGDHAELADDGII